MIDRRKETQCNHGADNFALIVNYCWTDMKWKKRRLLLVSIGIDEALLFAAFSMMCQSHCPNGRLRELCSHFPFHIAVVGSSIFLIQ